MSQSASKPIRVAHDFNWGAATVRSSRTTHHRARMVVIPRAGPVGFPENLGSAFAAQPSESCKRSFGTDASDCFTAARPPMSARPSATPCNPCLIPYLMATGREIR
ncbi:hypothetical protein MMOR_09970 [Mycolicibacterium moriokaense]|uniref:Uncharacterized protein n=1 Tax=Mycolicibacterium moriokaense TaxID=39691 RepID=A0AAD1M4W4_9MYCO|nr:hypothetical protein MMOR_09970 [Mycolicibacterium moriokaense]